jgi:hypothetical protein
MQDRPSALKSSPGGAFAFLLGTISMVAHETKSQHDSKKPLASSSA